MISGPRTRSNARSNGWRRFAVALAIAAIAAPAFAAGFDLTALMALVGRRPGGDARFVERRFVQGLDAPLASTGTLSFAAPDRLVRRTIAPRAESFVVDGNTLTLTRNGRSRSIALDSVPELLAVIEALRGTLTGNAAALQRHFRATLSGGAESWTLDLAPLDPRLGGQIDALRIAGRRDEVRSVETIFAGGDRSVMTIEPVAEAGPGAAPR